MLFMKWHVGNYFSKGLEANGMKLNFLGYLTIIWEHMQKHVWGSLKQTKKVPYDQIITIKLYVAEPLYSLKHQAVLVIACLW